ncbi:MAG: hypothetical protein IJ133_05180, partial [Clostridia bacterium]|nr:hypothetical protein [Clostridia bacterium]
MGDNSHFVSSVCWGADLVDPPHLENAKKTRKPGFANPAKQRFLSFTNVSPLFRLLYQQPGEPAQDPVSLIQNENFAGFRPLSPLRPFGNIVVSGFRENRDSRPRRPARS